MKRKCYKTLSAFDNEICVCDEKTNQDFGESVADDSFYVPESELVKRLRQGVTYGQALQGLYDFADGKDSGIAVPVDRYPGIDRAEVSEFVRRKEAEAKESFEKDVKAAAEKTAAEKAAAEKAAAENVSTDSNK